MKRHCARAGGITKEQVNSWLANRRNRTDSTKPKRERQAMEELWRSSSHWPQTGTPTVQSRAPGCSPTRAFRSSTRRPPHWPCRSRRSTLYLLPQCRSARCSRSSPSIQQTIWRTTLQKASRELKVADICSSSCKTQMCRRWSHHRLLTLCPLLPREAVWAVQRVSAAFRNNCHRHRYRFRRGRHPQSPSGLPLTSASPQASPQPLACVRLPRSTSSSTSRHCWWRRQRSSTTREPTRSRWIPSCPIRMFVNSSEDVVPKKAMLLIVIALDWSHTRTHQYTLWVNFVHYFLILFTSTLKIFLWINMAEYSVTIYNWCLAFLQSFAHSFEVLHFTVQITM